MEDNDVNLQLGQDMLQLIDFCVQQRMQQMTQMQSARVVGINDDETVDIIIPPSSTIYHRVQNQSIYALGIGDNVKIIKEGNKLNNMWIIGGFNLKKKRWE